MKLYKVIKIIDLTFIRLYKIRKIVIDCRFDPKVRTKILISYLQYKSQFGWFEISLNKYNKVIIEVIWDQFKVEKFIQYIISILQIF